jgi:hypothetical protein
VAREVGEAPSTLHMVFPEAYLGTSDATSRIRSIQDTMRSYLANAMFREREGAVYVERTLGDRIRRGLMLELDLEQYDFGSKSVSPIRPTEGTMVERLVPRIAVRRGAELELPHILVLIDDPMHGDRACRRRASSAAEAVRDRADAGRRTCRRIRCRPEWGERVTWRCAPGFPGGIAKRYGVPEKRR